MKESLTNYNTFVFDCDGVVLNSNRVKTNAFYKAALPYGHLAAQSLVDYHVNNGGVSRYKKFAFFLEFIAKPNDEGPSLEDLLKIYANEVYEGLLRCEIAPGLKDLRERTSHAQWLIVSGGDQEELREVFKFREISGFFDGGIFGSPDTKDDILARELASRNIKYPAIFFGDSKYDYQASNRAGLDFVFLSDWSEVKGWKEWCYDNELIAFDKLSDFI